MGGQRGNRTQSFSLQMRWPAFGIAPIYYAESEGFEPSDQINDHSLANYCNNHSANSPKCGRPETRTLTPITTTSFQD